MGSFGYSRVGGRAEEMSFKYAVQRNTIFGGVALSSAAMFG